MGGCRQHFVEAEEGYGDLITRPVQQALEHYLRDHFPELAGVAVDYRWSGVMAFTADGLPLLGELPDHPGVYFVTGCNGHGLGYSMVLSRQAVEMAMNVGNCAASPAQFSVNRSALRALSGAAKVRDRQNRQSAEREIGP